MYPGPITILIYSKVSKDFIEKKRKRNSTSKWFC